MKYPLPPVITPPGIPLGPDAVLVADKVLARDRGPQNDEERSLLALIDGKRTVAEILRVSRLSGFVAMRQLHSLSQRRLIRSLPHRPAPAPAPRLPSSRTTASRLGLTQDLTAVADTFVEGESPVTPPPERITVELEPIATKVIASRPVPLPPLARAPRLGAAANQAVELWFKLSKLDWATLVVVPGHRLGSGLPLACALVEAGSAISRQRIDLLSAEGHDLVPTTDWIFPRHDGERFQRIIALDSITANPMVIPVAQAAQAVLIVVERGAADMAAVKRTVEAIGRHRITGCVMISPKQ